LALEDAVWHYTSDLGMFLAFSSGVGRKKCCLAFFENLSALRTFRCFFSLFGIY